MLNIFLECVMILYYLFLLKIEIVKNGLGDWDLCTLASKCMRYLPVGLV